MLALAALTSPKTLLTGCITGQTLCRFAAALAVPKPWRTLLDASVAIYLKEGSGWFLSTRDLPVRHILTNPADLLNKERRFGYGEPALGEIIAWRNHELDTWLLSRCVGEGYEVRYLTPPDLPARRCMLRSGLMDFSVALFPSTAVELGTLELTQILSNPANKGRTVVFCERRLLSSNVIGH